MSTGSSQPADIRTSRTNGLTIASLVTAILSLVFFRGGWLFVATAAVAIFTGVKRAQAAVNGKGQRGIATTGLVLGIIAGVLEVIFFASVRAP